MSAVVKWTFEDYWQGASQTASFYPEGGVVDFVVPDDVTGVIATLRGGAGGGESIDNIPEGGLLKVQFPVSPGDVLHIRVGDNGARTVTALGGAGAYNGGGDGGDGGNGTISGHSAGYPGGGATDIRMNGDTLADRVCAAGGGGGNSGENYSWPGGSGGGGHGRSQPQTPCGGAPGTRTAPGAAYHGGHAGQLGVGGQGIDTWSMANGGGGGGGGWYGGAGGGNGTVQDIMHFNSGGGGGGSNGYTDACIVLADSQGGFNRTPAMPSVTIEWQGIADQYTWEINPNDNGAVTISKNMLMSNNTGPNRVNIVQEGQSQAPTLDFSGVILTQTHLEAMEKWFDRRALIKVTDDLGREYYGVFNKWAPRRVRRASNPWYHSYDAEFTLSAYRNASGDWLYGRML